MTTGMPELGSKISLISKADIRYEGRLFTVDPQECTIALASVRSFGTEERETTYPVPAQNQVYDYILFRGSDIKDIRVVNNVTHPQPLNDPAIMQLSVPPSLGGQQFQSHPVLGHMGAPMGQFGGAYGAIGAMGAVAPGMGMPGSLLRNSKPTSVLDLIGGGGGGGTRSTTPASLGSRKSPTNDQGVQAGGSKADGNKMVKPIQPPRNQRNKSRERRDSRGADNQEHRQGQAQNQRPQNRQYNHQQNNQQGYHGAFQNRGGWVNNRAPMRARGRGRGGYRPNQGQPNAGNKRNTLKFENDYDFEQANTEFEELKTKLAKVKLDDATVPPKAEQPPINGEPAKPETDSGNETGAGEPEQEEDPSVYYDKSKSFFDKISCEAVERAKGKSQRTDWRTERKLNSETFGVAATRRGNYRGRGGFRGMGYRGGYRGGYRQPQRRDNTASQQNNQQQSQQQGNRTQLINHVIRSDVTIVGATKMHDIESAAAENESSSERVTTDDESGGTIEKIAPFSKGTKMGGDVPEPAMAVRQ